MSNTVIKVENLAKQYRLGLIGGKTVQEDVQRWWARMRGKPDPLLTVEQLEKLQSQNSQLQAPSSKLPAPSSKLPSPNGLVWALQDVSFEVKQGEILGIIGRNGAGKSTLLKILTKITAPTLGKAMMKGRVGALLEVGTGFHPELTGRENIFLSGAILGMTKIDIKSRLDEIIDFSGCGQYIDTPVKRYSSGMGVRLGFAVAAHLEPEILLVDEVLAVGDAQFQKKCLGKMGEVAKEGRTVLFVSHNMIATQSLCPTVLWLEKGAIAQKGEAGQIVSQYLQSSSKETSCREQLWSKIETAPGNDLVKLHRVSVQLKNESSSGLITMKSSFFIEVEYWKPIPNLDLCITLHLYTQQGIVAFTTGSADGSSMQKKGLYRSICHMPDNLLNSGEYNVLVLVVKDRSFIVFRYENAVSFEIVDLAKRQTGWLGKEPGVVCPKLKWTTDYVGNMPL